MAKSDSESSSREPTNVPWADELIDAVDAFSAGESLVVLIEADDGSASRLLELLPQSVDIHARAVGAPATRARVGAIAEELMLEEYVGDAAVILEEAQWADPTSLGRLQRMLAEPTRVLMVVAHRPLSDVDGWWFSQLATEARERGRLLEVTSHPDVSEEGAPELDSNATDLVIATQLVTGPISVRAAASLLELPEREVLELGDRLTRQGWLRQERGGFRCVADATGLAAGDARTGYVAGRLAQVMADQGESASVVGSLQLAAGQPMDAFPLLFDASVEAERRHAPGEAYHLAADALRAAEEAGITEDDRLGTLHLICGRFLRSAGRTDWARAHLERATTYLEGVARVDALGFAAAVADDSQHPQEAERIISMAEWEAARLGEGAKLGSLWTFRSLILSRIGFAEEADHLLAKGRALLDQDSTARQRFHASQNKAWTHFDRGEAKLAEAEFTHLRDEAGQLEGPVSVADKEAWRARALFAAGHPGQALEAIEVVEEIAARERVEAPVFLAQLALADGSFTYGRYEDALAASERVLDLVQRQLPAWENMARSYRAHALMQLGRLGEARDEIEAAIAASPPGANGWRWRTRCLALKMEIDVALGERWDARGAEDLADLMLQSRFYHWAADLLCAIATHGKRKSAASEAMAIAVKVGRPMTAARAASIGGLWSDPAAAQAVTAMRAIEQEIPEEWAEKWRALPWVTEGLAQPEPTEDFATEAATAALEEALRKAGLAGDEVLSPAQRRSSGLVRRPRVLRPMQMIAAAAAVVILAGGTAFAVVAANQEEPSPVTTAPPVAEQTTVPEPLTLEETVVAAPERVAGTAEYRGGNGRSGFLESQGLREVTGRFWMIQTASAIEASPVAFGQQLFVGSTDGTFYALAQDDGNQNWTKPAEGRISTAPALGDANFGEGPVEKMIVVVDDEGLVRAFRADNGTEEWRLDLGPRIRSTPVIADGRVYVGTADGFVHAFELTTGEQLWVYPEGDEGVGVISADLAYDDGYVYAGTESGFLHVIDVTGATPSACQFDGREAIMINPIVVDSVVYVSTNGQTIWTLPAGACEGVVPDRQAFYVTEAPISVAPAIVGDTIYLPTTRFLYARDLVTSEFVWPADKVTGESSISAAPVVTEDAVYFADEDGVVQAVDRATGDLLWTWRTGLHVRGSPAVVDGAVYITSGDTFVYAVSGGEVLDEQG